MRDLRLNKWAEILVHYSLEAKPNQHAILLGSIESLPLFQACYETLIRAGAIVEPFLTSGEWSEILFQHGSSQQISSTPPTMLHAIQHCDLYLTIGAEYNTRSLNHIPPQKQSLASQARHPILKTMMQRAAEGKLKWVYTHFPTAAAAQEAEMGTREYQELIFSLGHLNAENPISEWKNVEKKQQHLVRFLETKKELHFQNGDGTDLKVNVSGMKWMNSCGKRNFPDGEVYTGPNLTAPDGGVNGVARYSFPTLYRNVEVQNVELVFEKGAVVRCKASKGEAFLKEMIHQDPGAKFVGEIAIGTNPHMKHITKNILLDEKFGGTFHLALGQGYPQTGNTNPSALHWDLIFDLRQNGSIHADGECILKDGQLSLPVLEKV